MTLGKTLKNLLLISLTIVAISACGNDNNPFEVDYSDAPILPDTTNALSKVTLESGLIYYVITEGSPESFDVVIRDDIYVYYTTRTEDEEIIGSSYANGSTAPVRVNNVGSQSAIRFVGSGFASGVIGMKEGERRVLVIPTDLNSISEPIVIDIELETIDY